MVASYELGGGWIHVAKATIGKRAFLGNSGITQPGRRVPDDGLVAVLSATPHKAKAGSSWLGSPPVRLRRKPTAADALRTFHPSVRLKVAARRGRDLPARPGDGDVRDRRRPCCCRLQCAGGDVRLAVGGLAAGLVLLAAGAVAGGIAVLAKWLVVGRIRAIEHPLWSSFVWRNEVVGHLRRDRGRTVVRPGRDAVHR